MNYWLWIDLSYACFGIHIDGNNVIETPPIGSWMKKESAHEVIIWLQKRNATLKVLDDT
jgi:hypothetical protein